MPKRCYRVRRTEKRNPLLRTKKVENRTQSDPVWKVFLWHLDFTLGAAMKRLSSHVKFRSCFEPIALCAARCFSKPPLFMPFFSISHLQISVIDGLKLGNWIFKKSSKPGQESFFNSSNIIIENSFPDIWKATFESWLSGRFVGLQNIFRFGSFSVWNWVKIAFED